MYQRHPQGKFRYHLNSEIVRIWHITTNLNRIAKKNYRMHREGGGKVFLVDTLDVSQTVDHIKNI